MEPGASRCARHAARRSARAAVASHARVIGNAVAPRRARAGPCGTGGRRMRTANAGWCRTLGNYPPDARAAHTVAQVASLQTHTPMAFKSPRLPNPNIALLER